MSAIGLGVGGGGGGKLLKSLCYSFYMVDKVVTDELTRAQGYETFFMHNSVEDEILNT